MTRFLPHITAALFIPMFLSCQSISNAYTNFIISDADEISMGAKFKAQILADTKTYPQYTKDQSVINYINSMGQTLAAAQSDRKNIPFTFNIIDDTVVNAFSLPGGPVFIYRGLLQKANSGAEVATVLAHEIGHIAMRHSAKKIAESEGVSVVEQILLGNDSTSTAVVANLLVGMAFLKFSRGDELQADSCGVSYSYATHFNPYGMKNFFVTLKALYGDAPFEAMLSDHPTTSDRITNAQRLINKLPSVPTDTNGLHIAEYLTLKPKI